MLPASKITAAAYDVTAGPNFNTSPTSVVSDVEALLRGYVAAGFNSPAAKHWTWYWGLCNVLLAFWNLLGV